jgi:septal ring factor EnvC (AmiA/AmiB activator)
MAIEEQQERIAALEAETARLRERIAELENDLIARERSLSEAVDDAAGNGQEAVRLREAHERIRQLEAALRPFADLDTLGAAEYVAAGLWKEDARFHYLVRVRDLIRARDMLGGHSALTPECHDTVDTRHPRHPRHPRT